MVSVCYHQVDKDLFKQTITPRYNVICIYDVDDIRIVKQDADRK